MSEAQMVPLNEDLPPVEPPTTCRGCLVPIWVNTRSPRYAPMIWYCRVIRQRIDNDHPACDQHSVTTWQKTQPAPTSSL